MNENKKKRVSCSNEFKELAIDKCGKISVRETSKELGVSVHTLNSWISKAIVQGHDVAAGPSYEDLQKENLRLKKELSYVHNINHVLKKSVGIFSRPESRGLK